MSAPAKAVSVVVSVREPALAQRLERAIAASRRASQRTAREAAASTTGLRVAHLRTRRKLAALGPEAVAGALVVVRVTDRGARRVPALVAELRGLGVAGIQLVWDGEDPSRARAEHPVFTALEAARATPTGPPVVVACGAEPARVLRLLIAKRRERTS